ncbi:FAD-dependent monooxygenase [Neobacillus dielmonensis]|uniref:FAD-dependent monooxygenase n=1 Tax=Neobacillus dielmonensis TaxID=1347369 RepID=UPI0005AAF1A6|nr:FAD-dependent monooxygenase [Neobacillus dielmonensis]
MAKIIIIGGGIGGLCTGIALQQRGHDISIYESTSTFQSTGAGLGIGSNAVKALDKLNLKDSVMKHSKVLNKMIVLSEKGTPLTETDSLLVSERFGTDNVTIHRADLHHVLRHALRLESIVLNKKCVDFMQDQDGVTISFQDGGAVRADAVIAADGVNSLFRRKLVPNSSPRYAGYTCWRGIVSNHNIEIDQAVATETWGSSGRFGIVPLADGKVYWFACIKAKARDPQAALYGIKDLSTIFKNYHSPIQQIIEATSEEALIHNDILDIKPIQQFAFGRIVLLGDAAHATTPNLGQGAGQAMEDAYILAKCLESSEAIETAFKAFERKRVRRTNKIIKMSKQVGQIAQLQNKWLIPLRNAVMKLVPPSVSMKRFEFLYDVNWD